MIPLGILGNRRGGAAAGAYELISTTVLSSTASSVTFSSIDTTTYKHLEIRAVTRTNRANTREDFGMRLNSDSATNYSWHYLDGSGASVASGGGATQNVMYVGLGTPASTETANIFGVSITSILDYASTAKYKTIRTLYGTRGGTPDIALISGNWRSTVAVTSVTLLPLQTGSFVSGSRFSLYGIK